jgi:uncharacterized protein with von Willebrand factor type A (vWA) domain
MLTGDGALAVELGALLRARLTGFSGFLRANGFGVGGAEAVCVLETGVSVGILDPRVLRWSLKALLCGRSDEWRRFDHLFDAYFLPPNKSLFTQGGGAGGDAAREVAQAGAAGAGSDASPRPGHGLAGAESDASLRSGHGVAGVESDASLRSGHGVDGAESDASLNSGRGAADDRNQGSSRHGASREESLSSTDFRRLHEAQDAYAIEALMRRFARRLRPLLLRREATHHHGRRLDLQATIRRSVASGGTPIRLAWKERRRVRPRIVLLVDVSQSMSLYSFFYMRLARALLGELADVHCFVFHTRITEVGAALRDPDPWRSQARLQLLAIGWAGGTRIGECLRDFNRGHGARLVHSRTAVIVVSDGFDTGEPALLAASLATLRRRSRCLVWLNPLLNQPGYTPESRGMRAAMPHIDLLAAGADLAAVEQIIPRVLRTLR